MLMYVGGQRLTSNIHFLVKFRISKNSYFINNKPTFLKLWIFTNFYFPVAVLVFDFEEFSEDVLHGYLPCLPQLQMATENREMVYYLLLKPSMPNWLFYKRQSLCIDQMFHLIFTVIFS
jgi:hypothetical protein